MPYLSGLEDASRESARSALIQTSAPNRRGSPYGPSYWQRDGHSPNYLREPPPYIRDEAHSIEPYVPDYGPLVRPVEHNEMSIERLERILGVGRSRRAERKPEEPQKQPPETVEVPTAGRRKILRKRRRDV